MSEPGPIDLQPTLVGETITLRPLQAADLDALYQAASDPLIWAQHPDATRHRRDVFEARYFAGAVASGGALTVVHNPTGVLIGSSRYYDWNEDSREISIGYTFLERRFWGRGTNPEMKRLMLDHALRWARLVWFQVGRDNWRSRQALEKIGARYSHEETAAIDGVPYVQLYYRIDRVP